MNEVEWDIFLDIHKDMPRQGSGRNEYTKKAYDMIPPLSHPNILDIGCGPGMQTIELAKLSGGHIIGMDIFQQYLDQLEESIRKEQLQDQVEVMNQSMLDMNFASESFNIIWAEGSIFVIGFEKGLQSWRQFITSKGYLAVHDMAWINPDPPEEIKEYWETNYPDIKTIQEHIEIIKKCNYTLLGYFPLPEDAWWEFYYEPLQNRLVDLRIKYKENPTALALIEEEQQEIDLFKKYNHWFGSVFYIMQKVD